MVYTQELLDQVQAWLALPLNDKRSPAGLTALVTLISDFTGQPPEPCRQCQYSDRVAVVKAYERQSLRFLHPHLMPDSQYSFAPGYENETFVHESYSEALTAENLTDAGAEFFSKNGFAHAFVKKASADNKPAAPKLLKADHQARYKELFGEEPDEKLTVEKLIEANEAKQAELDKQD